MEKPSITTAATSKKEARISKESRDSSSRSQSREKSQPARSERETSEDRKARRERESKSRDRSLVSKVSLSVINFYSIIILILRKNGEMKTVMIAKSLGSQKGTWAHPHRHPCAKVLSLQKKEVIASASF